MDAENNKSAHKKADIGKVSDCKIDKYHSKNNGVKKLINIKISVDKIGFNSFICLIFFYCINKSITRFIFT